MHDEYLLAKKFAQKHVNVRKIQSGTSLYLSECSEIFYWSDEHFLFEFPIVCESGYPAGYVICSGNPVIPAVLESANEGGPLSQFLRERMWHRLIARKIVPRGVRYYYLNPFEFVALAQTSDELIAMHSRTFSLRKLDSFEGLMRSPEQIWSKDTALASFEQLEDEMTAARVTPQILLNFKPTKYNQTCKGSIGSGALLECSESTFSEREDYCAPKCIAGCIPVAWAMLASSFKRGNFKNRGHEIFRDSTGWEADWYWSNGQIQVLSKRVNKFIWDAHRICNTKCYGSTIWDDTAFGERLFWEFGLNWSFVVDKHVSWGDVTATIENERSLLLGGSMDWSSLYPDRTIDAESRDNDGHMVCMYGYKPSGTVYVSMGWGKALADRSVRFDALRDPVTVKYVRERSLGDEADLKVENIATE